MPQQVTAKQIEMVRSSWMKVVPDGQHHGEQLMHKLFEFSPQLMDLFPFGRDLSNPFFTEHALNVVNALDFAIKKLDNTAQLIPKLEELGRVHAPFELSTKEFDVLGQALLWVLEKALGDDFTPSLRTAWEDVFGVVREVMLRAMQE